MRHTAAVLAVTGAFALLYRPVAAKLVHDWATDDNYSHGFLIVPLALYFAWQRRGSLLATPLKPSNWGLFYILAALATLGAGILGAELFLTRISIPLVLTGMVLFVLGPRHLRLLSFPIAFLLLMIPVPAIIFNQIAFPLQLVASTFGQQMLSGLNVPVFREGNVIVLPHTALEVAEACSGIRSLVSLLTLGLVYGYFADPRNTVRAMLVVATIPIAIATNGLRVAGLGLVAHWYGPSAIEGWFHTFSGWLVFVAAFAMLVVVQLVTSRMASLLWRRGPALAPALAK